ncbi:hypothetical protein G7Y79_00016g040440 [Physcia stellaris]|nr:hypothetical protein G7Y79_00016g040440 [Physcia stellaris]
MPSLVDTSEEELYETSGSNFCAGYQSEEANFALHPVLQAAVDQVPIERPEHLVRLHPAIANADLRSRYLTDPEVNIPRSLFSSPTSRDSSISESSSQQMDAKESISSGSETVTSLQTDAAPASSTLAEMLTKEIDAEISAQLDAQDLQDWDIYDITAAGTSQNYNDNAAYSDKKGEPDVANLQPSISGLKAELRTENVQVELRNKIGASNSPRYKMVKISSSNLRALAVAEAFARVQTFKASREYLTYQQDQELIFSNPHQRNAVAKHRLAEIKKTPAWTRYAADLALVLEHGDAEDVENVTDYDSRRASSTTPSSPAIGELRKPRLRRVGPWMQTWSSLGKTMEKAEMWD